MTTVKCTDSECTHHGSEIKIHDDTVLPVLCGGCGEPLRCDHEETRYAGGLEGTAANPVLVNRTLCAQCNTVLSEQRTELTREQLAEIPAAVLLGGAVGPQ